MQPTAFMGKTEVPTALAQALAEGHGLDDAPQGPVLAAVRARLAQEIELLQRQDVADETPQQIGRRLGSISALRWVLDLPGLARSALGYGD